MKCIKTDQLTEESRFQEGEVWIKELQERAKLGSSERGGLEALADVFGANMKDPLPFPQKNVAGKALLGLQSRSVLESRHKAS